MTICGRRLVLVTCPAVFLLLWLWLFEAARDKETASGASGAMNHGEARGGGGAVGPLEEKKPEKRGARAPAISGYVDFGEQWNRIDSGRELTKRDKMELKQELMKKFVTLYGIEYAFEHIPRVCGPGDERNVMMMLAFEYAGRKTGYADLVALAKTACGPDEREYALAGVLQLVESKGATVGDLESFLPVTKKEAVSLGHTLQFMVKAGRLSLEEGVRLLNSSDPDLSPEVFTRFLQSIAITKSKDVAEYSLANLSKSPEVLRGALGACLNREMNANAPEGMAYAIRFESENKGLIDPTLIIESMTTFYHKDAGKAEEWLAHHGNTVTGAVHDALQAARAIRSAGADDFAGARRMVADLQDPKVIAYARQQLDRLEGAGMKQE